MTWLYFWHLPSVHILADTCVCMLQYHVLYGNEKSRCPAEGWVKMKMWCVYPMGFYPAVKKNEILKISGNGWN